MLFLVALLGLLSKHAQSSPNTVQKSDAVCQCLNEESFASCLSRDCAELHVERSWANTFALTLANLDNSHWALSSILLPKTTCDFSHAEVRLNSDCANSKTSWTMPAEIKTNSDGSFTMEIPSFNYFAASATIIMPSADQNCLKQLKSKSILATYSRMKQEPIEKHCHHNMIYMAALAGALVYTSL